jgi:hypothetical protein
MSRLTGTDAKNLMEAYSEVYAPQEELTEEQIWEEVENWVNSLVEEGHDLSEYTWEELYESYIEEQGRSGRGPMDPAVKSRWQAIGNTLATGNPQGTRPTPSSRPTNLRGGGRTTSTVTAKPSVTPTPSRFAGARDAAFAKARQIQGSPVVGPRQPAATARPAAPASRPAAAARPAAASPATSKPTTAPSSTASTSAAPARPSLSSQADEIRKMRASSLQRQGKPLDAATVSASTKPAFQANSFDPFDVIKGHLLDEGYADTEESALAIMTNMSETWKEEILEGVLGEDKKYDRNRQRAAQRAAARNAARRDGRTGNVPGVGYVSPRPEGETYRDSSGVERHTSGARMPKKD